MKVKALLAIAAALALSACVVADDPYYDDYSRENSARDYDHYDHGPRYRDRDDRDYRDYRDDRRSRRRGLFGKGAEWHQKGDEAFFSFIDPYGNKVDTSCRAR